MTELAMANLAEFLEAEQKKLGYRELEEKAKVSRGALEKIIKGYNKQLPEIETLQRIAEAYDLKLWEVVEMAGVNLDLPQTPSERARRLAALIESRPILLPFVERLLDMSLTDPDFVSGMLVSMEVTLAQRGKDAR